MPVLAYRDENRKWRCKGADINIAIPLLNNNFIHSNFYFYLTVYILSPVFSFPSKSDNTDLPCKMAYKVLQAAFFTALVAAGTNKRITGGVPAQASEFPYIVKVGRDCGGSLLDSTTVLTAGHCWRSYEDNKWVESPAKPVQWRPISSLVIPEHG